MKRIMIAGTHGGCGKSDVISGVMQALVNRGMKVSSFKNGPSYIDPVFNETVLKIPSYNLDTYLMAKNTVNYLLDKNSSEIAVLAGNFGFYDGYSFTPTASSCELSLWTDTPVALVVNCSGRGASIGAVMKGYLEYGRNNIKGMIFTNIKASMYPFMKQECEKLGLRSFGYFPTVEKKAPVSHHLSLATSLEIDDARARVQKLAEIAEETIDIDELLRTAAEAPALDYDFRAPHKIADVRIAVARDKAFSMYYKDNIELLRELGAEIVPFSPLEDEKLPENVNGMILGDGYVAIHAKKLSENESMMRSVKEAIDGGLPTIAVGSGYMYLHEKVRDYTTKEYKMAGVIEGECSRNDAEPGYCYITLVAREDNMLCDKGESIATYATHYYDSTAYGRSFDEERTGYLTKSIRATMTMFAGFPHLHFYSNLDFAKNFIKACTKFK